MVDPADCKSYRPISLLGYDEKVLSKLLANRLNKVITSLIHPDQVGFIPKRSYSNNIRRLIDIMWATRDANTPLDTEKAFDRVERLSLFLTLESFGFSNTFITWIQLLYTHPTAAVQTNGLIYSWFELGRGMRQGDSISPGLFALALEPLAAAIRLELSFPGIQIGRSPHKLMLYADDIVAFVSDPERSLPALLTVIDKFSKLSGYKFSWQKSEALSLTQYCPKTLFQGGNFSWPSAGIKYLV